MRAGAERLAARGIRSLQVWVQDGNSATRFYEALGGRRARTAPFDLATLPWLAHLPEPLVFNEVEYVWPDTMPLMERDR